MNELLFSNIDSISLQIILCSGLIVSSLLVNLSKNPVESVLFLVLSFTLSGILMIILLSEFFGITLIIIYVGAIAVLFIFVIMMLNIKEVNIDEEINNDLSNNLHEQNNKEYTSFTKILFSIAGLYLIGIYFMYRTEHLYRGFKVTHALFQIDELSHTEILGQVLYNYYIECFLIAGLLLLVALIGSIILTLQFNIKKNKQIIARQLSRQDEELSSSYK